MIWMDRFSIPWEGEYQECWNACRKCGEENCECPRPCPFSLYIGKCSKAHECKEPCWEDEEDEGDC